MAKVESDTFGGWSQWASRSKLKPFVRLARTVRKHKQGIIAYTQTGLSNGVVEGLNNKIRLVLRRAYGFRDTAALKAGKGVRGFEPVQIL